VIRTAGVLGFAMVLAVPPGLSAQNLADPFAGEPDLARFEAAGFQEILLEFRIGRLTSHTIRAFSDGAVALLPASAVFEIAEVEYEFLASGILQATLYPEDLLLRIDPDSATAHRDAQPVEVTAEVRKP